MYYMGGKARLARRITETILQATNNRSLLIEPFIGGGWVTAQLASHFDAVKAYDVHEDLVQLWQQGIDRSFEPPKHVSRELYHELKAQTMHSALRGLVGFGMSFGGKWFGGYTGGWNLEEVRSQAKNAPRSYWTPARNGYISKVEAIRPNTTVELKSFYDLEITPDAVVYCDPPYASTTDYTHSFDSERFWCGAEEWSKVSEVFVSEATVRPGWEVLWSIERRRDMRTGDGRMSQELLMYKGPHSGS